MTDSSTDILIELSKTELELLEWFSQWTPDVHRANWKSRRAWPPGFREITDVSATWEGHDKYKKAVERQSVGPDPKKGDWGLANSAILEYRLIEGCPGCYRLTPRGRSALLHNGYSAPDRFQSHCSEIFDDVPLTPVVLHNEFRSHEPGEKAGTPLPDEPESWRRMLVEYRESDYQGRHTLTCASALLTRWSSTGTNLNGSIRKHSSGVSIDVRSETGQRVMEAQLSLEGFTDLLTSNSNVPLTLGFYIGIDGMGRSEPAPPPVSASRRMRERLASSEHRQDQVIAGVEAKVSALLDKGRISQKAAKDLLHDLAVARNNGDANRVFVVKQAIGEVSAATESLLTIAGERMMAAGDLPQMLNAGKTALVAATVIEEEGAEHDEQND